jgi:hypothetical protein
MENKHMENTVEIAVLKEQIKGIREQQSAHAKDTRERFDDMGHKLDELLAMLNKGKGAYAVLFMLSGVIGALVIKVGGAILGWVKQ